MTLPPSEGDGRTGPALGATAGIRPTARGSRGGPARPGLTRLNRRDRLPAMSSEHRYHVQVTWTGNLGSGTREYRGYARAHSIEIPGAPAILATSGLGPRRDPDRVDPEELLVSALSSCHLLTYLHLCSRDGIVVTEYTDGAEGTLRLDPGGGGRMVSVTLHPRVVISDGSPERANELHEEAHRTCFIASSVNFPVTCEPSLVRGPSPPVPPRTG